MLLSCLLPLSFIPNYYCFLIIINKNKFLLLSDRSTWSECSWAAELISRLLNDDGCKSPKMANNSIPAEFNIINYYHNDIIYEVERPTHGHSGTLSPSDCRWNRVILYLCRSPIYVIHRPSTTAKCLACVSDCHYCPRKYKGPHAVNGCNIVVSSRLVRCGVSSLIHNFIIIVPGPFMSECAHTVWRD